MRVLTFAASASRNSINKQFALHAGRELQKLNPDVELEVIDINDYEMPIFSAEREEELGQPAEAKAFAAKIAEADAIILSLAEYNGSYTAAYKNLFDWTSRISLKVYEDKPMILLSTSPGPGGAATVLKTAETSMPFFGGIVKATLSLPSFFDNFDVEEGRVTNPEFSEGLNKAVNRLLEQPQTEAA